MVTDVMLLLVDKVAGLVFVDVCNELVADVKFTPRLENAVEFSVITPTEYVEACDVFEIKTFFVITVAVLKLVD